MHPPETIAVSVPSTLAPRTRQALRQGRAASVSVHVASALEEKLELDKLSTLLDEMLAEFACNIDAPRRRRVRTRRARSCCSLVLIPPRRRWH